MDTIHEERVAAMLLERLAAGDTLAAIEGQELVDRLCDECERIWRGDPLHVDYEPATGSPALSLLSTVLSVLYDDSEGLDDAMAVADAYRAHGGREVRYACRRTIVWHCGADPTWQIFDRPTSPAPAEPIRRAELLDTLDSIETTLEWLRWRAEHDDES